MGILCLAAFVEISCGISGSPSTGPPAVVVVSVTPTSANLFLDATQSFQAIVTGISNTSVTWEVNAVPGGTASAGTISAAGVYTAPVNLPSPPSVTVTAVSQATFATPAALAASPGAYDLESLLAHEIGHWFGFDHSAVWRALMFPFAPPPGQFLGDRPTAQAPDGPLSDDDRTGIRLLYPDPNDTVDIGAIRGRIVPANPFALATISAPSSGASVSGIFGAHVVAVDTGSGAVVAGTLGGWSCDPANPVLQFDGAFDIERLSVGHSYMIYAEPLVGVAMPGDFSDALNDLCASGSASVCTTPAVGTNFSPRIRPAVP